MTTITRVSDEIKRAVKHQLTFIKNSSDLWKAGCREEAIRISAAINLLLEERRRSLGLLRLLDQPFKLLSTIPELHKLNLARLIILASMDVAQAEGFANKNNTEIKNQKKFILAYISDQGYWHIFAYDVDGNYISCDIDELLEHTPLLKRGERGVFNLPRWIEMYSDEKHNISDEGKEHIIKSLGHILNGEHFLEDKFSPMILHGFDENIHTTSDHLEERHLSVDEWYTETLFACLDEENVKHTLTRKLLVETTRDKDGGGHFDKTLKDDAYYQSKKKCELGVMIGDKQLSIQDAHLIMLQQLGYEILNSPSIFEFIK